MWIHRNQVFGRRARTGCIIFRTRGIPRVLLFSRQTVSTALRRSDRWVTARLDSLSKLLQPYYRQFSRSNTRLAFTGRVPLSVRINWILITKTSRTQKIRTSDRTRHSDYMQLRQVFRSDVLPLSRLGTSRTTFRTISYSDDSCPLFYVSLLTKNNPKIILWVLNYFSEINYYTLHHYEIRISIYSYYTVFSCFS
jgi:hypothetical protein